MKLANLLGAGVAVTLLLTGTSANAQWICEDAPPGRELDTLSDGRIVMVADILDDSGQRQGAEILLRDPVGNWGTIGLIDNAMEGYISSTWKEIEVGLNDEIYVGGNVTPEGKGNPLTAVVVQKGVWNGLTWDWEIVDFYKGESRKGEPQNIKDMAISNAGHIAWAGRTEADEPLVTLRTSDNGGQGTWATSGMFQEYVWDISLEFDDTGKLYVVTSQFVSKEITVPGKGRGGKVKTDVIGTTPKSLWTQDVMESWTGRTIYGGEPDNLTYGPSGHQLLIDDGRLIVALTEKIDFRVDERNFVIISSIDGGVSWTEDARIAYEEQGDISAAKMHQDAEGVFYFSGTPFIDGIETTVLYITDSSFSSWVSMSLPDYGTIRSLTSNATGLSASFYTGSENNCNVAFLPW